MTSNSPAFGLIQAGLDMARLSLEAQNVIGLRLLGMAGLVPMAPSEYSRMMTEKQFAFARSAQGTAWAMAQGGRADVVLGAATAPLQEATSANLRRLTSP